MLQVILYQPEIPPNTGNIIRLCANSGADLHLVGPLGFHVDDARLRRAGLDYHDMARVHRYDHWQAFERCSGIKKLWGLTTRARQTYSGVRFGADDGLLFGPESRGLPESLLDSLGQDRLLRIPMQEGSRSLNLSNAVAITLYEAWRQLDFMGI